MKMNRLYNMSMVAAGLMLAAAMTACSTKSKTADGDVAANPATLPTPADAAVPEYEGYKLVWADEFNGDKLSDEWSFEEGFVRNEELQWYLPQNASVADGCLVIEGRQEKFPNPNYDPESNDWRRNREYVEFTSSCVTTQKSHAFKYGRFEVRAKIPTASGSWPAIWLLGNKWHWPENGEIDMMEYYIRDGVPSILANACWGSENPHAPTWDDQIIPFTHFTEKNANWADEFHIWRMDWDTETINLYLDDELLNQVNLAETFNASPNNKENPFSNDIEGFGDYILLNLAIGSNGGEPNLEAFPLKYLVDYVRVYQKAANE